MAGPDKLYSEFIEVGYDPTATERLAAEFGEVVLQQSLAVERLAAEFGEVTMLQSLNVERLAALFVEVVMIANVYPRPASLQGENLVQNTFVQGSMVSRLP